MSALDLPSLAEEKKNESGMFYRTLGRTGEKVSAIGLGGYARASCGAQHRCAWGIDRCQQLL